MRSLFVGYFFRVFCPGFISSNTHNHIHINMLFLPTGQRGFGILASTLHYFVGSMKTGTGRKPCGFKRLGERTYGGGRYYSGRDPKDTMSLLHQYPDFNSDLLSSAYAQRLPSSISLSLSLLVFFPVYTYFNLLSFIFSLMFHLCVVFIHSSRCFGSWNLPLDLMHLYLIFCPLIF